MSDYEDVGYHGRPSAWDGVLENDCPRCKAQPGQKCVNPISGKTAHVPCIARVRVVPA